MNPRGDLAVNGHTPCARSSQGTPGGFFIERKDMRAQYFIAVLLLVFIGCSDSGSDDKAPPPAFDFTGTWNGTMTGASSSSNFVIVGTQTGSTIAGVLTNDGGFTFDIAGSASGTSISLTGTDQASPTYKIYCSGTCDGSYADGTWSDSVGQSGTWDAAIQ